MRDLPVRARIFIASTLGLAALCVGSMHFVVLPQTDRSPWELGFFLVLGGLAGGRKVHLTRQRGTKEAGCLSLGFAVTFLAILHFGTLQALLVAAAVSVSTGLFPKRQALHQLVFNLSLAMVDAWASGFVMAGLNQFRAIYGFNAFPAVCAACLVYFLINTLAVSGIIAACSNQRPRRVWIDTFLWTAPSYFIAAAASFVLLWLFGDNAIIALLFGAPIIFLTYQAIATYSNRSQEKVLHIEELETGKAKLADLYLATIKSLALAIAAKDQYTQQHILRVQHYAVATAKAMGLEGSELEGLNTGALLHDIGKLGVPEHVLLKPGPLSDDEFEKVKMHPEIGAAILDPVEFPWPVVPVVKYHHESWDGTGYPEGLVAENIPLSARILSVADVYDALTSDRSYRRKWDHKRAIEQIRSYAGTKFDPAVVDVFCRVIQDCVKMFDASNQSSEPISALKSKASLIISPKADQAARAIYRASSELWALYEVAQTLSTSLGLQETLDILARKLEAIVSGTACVFVIRDRETDTMRVRSAVGVN